MRVHVEVPARLFGDWCGGLEHPGRDSRQQACKQQQGDLRLSVLRFLYSVAQLQAAGMMLNKSACAHMFARCLMTRCSQQTKLRQQQVTVGPQLPRRSQHKGPAAALPDSQILMHDIVLRYEANKLREVDTRDGAERHVIVPHAPAPLVLLGPCSDMAKQRLQKGGLSAAAGPQNCIQRTWGELACGNVE